MSIFPYEIPDRGLRPACSAEEIMADMNRLGLEFDREEIDKIVATEARRRELLGDTGSQEFYNDKVRRFSGSHLHGRVPTVAVLFSRHHGRHAWFVSVPAWTSLLAMSRYLVSLTR